MSEYIIAYLGGAKMPDNPEEDKARWMAWVEGLGDAEVNPGTPLGTSKIVSSDGVSDDGGANLTGFSIVKADSMDAALEMAKACPYVEIGSVEVAEVMEM